MHNLTSKILIFFKLLVILPQFTFAMEPCESTVDLRKGHNYGLGLDTGIYASYPTSNVIKSRLLFTDEIDSCDYGAFHIGFMKNYVDGDLGISLGFGVYGMIGAIFNYEKYFHHSNSQIHKFI